MPKFKMEIYNAQTGVEFGVSWKDEREFLLAKAFLKELVGGPAGRNEFGADKPEFYYFETKEQLAALLAFQRTLRSGR